MRFLGRSTPFVSAPDELAHEVAAPESPEVVPAIGAARLPIESVERAVPSVDEEQPEPDAAPAAEPEPEPAEEQPVDTADPAREEPVEERPVENVSADEQPLEAEPRDDRAPVDVAPQPDAELTPSEPAVRNANTEPAPAPALDTP